MYPYIFDNIYKYVLPWTCTVDNNMADLVTFENFCHCEGFFGYNRMRVAADRALEEMLCAETDAKHALHLHGLKVEELNACQENLHPLVEAFIKAKTDALHAVKDTMTVALGAAEIVKVRTKLHANAKVALSRCESECREQLKRMETEVTSGDKQKILDNLAKRLKFLSLPRPERSVLTMVHMVMPRFSDISKFRNISPETQLEIGKNAWPQNILPLVCEFLMR